MRSSGSRHSSSISLRNGVWSWAVNGRSGNWVLWLVLLSSCRVVCLSRSSDGAWLTIATNWVSNMIHRNSRTVSRDWTGKMAFRNTVPGYFVMVYLFPMVDACPEAGVEQCVRNAIKPPQSLILTNHVIFIQAYRLGWGTNPNINVIASRLASFHPTQPCANPFSITDQSLHSSHNEINCFHENYQS